MAMTTYEQTTTRTTTQIRPKQIAHDLGETILAWLGRIGERSAAGRSAANYRRLNALSDAELARMDMKRSDLLERCFGWRAYY